jgi:hypothetical protein
MSGKAEHGVSHQAAAIHYYFGRPAPLMGNYRRVVDRRQSFCLCPKS